MAGYNQPQQIWVSGSNGVILKSTNLGVNWTRLTNFPPNYSFRTISCRGIDTVLAVGYLTGFAYVFRTTNGGINWNIVISMPGVHSIWMKNGTQGFLVGFPQGGRWSLWKTTNGGANWDSTGLFVPQVNNEYGFDNSLAIMYNHIWFGTNNSRIYRSTNNGLNWSFVTTPEVNSSAVWIYRDTSFNIFGYFGGNNIYRTTNGGINWIFNTCPDSGMFRGFCPGYYGVDNNPMCAYAIRNNNKIYFAGFGGSNFIPEYTAPSGKYTHMAYDGNMMYWQYTWAVRDNGGITRISLFRGGAVKRISDVIPESFGLNQNYPNPFNPATNIEFRTAEFGFVRLTVFDILGREVTTLVNEKLASGEYEVSFDASNLTSGVYFYRLRAENYSAVKKMVLVK
jgi:photosystem II stability/assembly factor-like uncharacterized protein